MTVIYLGCAVIWASTKTLTSLTIYNGLESQRCKCKECGIYYTVEPKRHAYPEETRELAIKMYYGGVSGRGVGKILKMNKSNVMNWIKKDHSEEG